MDIVITLPSHLWNDIVSGKKKIELRNAFPKKYTHSIDKCYVCAKGENQIVGYFMISSFTKIPNTEMQRERVSSVACINPNWVESYYRKKKEMKAWVIGKVHRFKEPIVLPYKSIKRSPQSFTYL